MIWGIQASVLTQDPQDSLWLSPDDLSLAGQLGDSLTDDGDIGGDLLGVPLDGLGDPLERLGPESNEGPNHSGDETTAAADPHEAMWTEDCYPSAEACRSCHPAQHEQWRASGHAYADVSPMFSRFEQAMTDLTRGTVWSFSARCHSPVGTQLKIPRAASMLEAPPVVREGVTCIACHRIREPYWRSNGDRRIASGDVHQAVGSSGNGVGLREAIQRADELKLGVHADSYHAKTFHGEPERGQPERAIPKSSCFFELLKNSDVCVSCHQVAVGNRYQFPVSNWTLLWFDAMYGWRGELSAVDGT